MLLWAELKGDGSLVVAANDHCGIPLAYVQLIQEPPQPDGLFSCLWFWPRNLASQFEGAATLWSFNCQLIVPLPMSNRYPTGERLVSRYPPQSASVSLFGIWG